MWHVSADVKTAEDLALPVPQLSMRPDGQRGPQIVVVPGSAQLQDLVADLGRRADAVRARAVKPNQDNMLKISGDGRAAALDLRLVGERTDETTKLDVAADKIAAIWRAHRDDRFPEGGGGQHPAPGGLQLVFSDLGTPNPERWNVYQQLRGQLYERGLLAGSVRFMQAAMFQAARTGQIAVLIGSTQRMGVGTNVQARAVALHHLDCPWRPADIQQREGRILRQGNHNPEVDILRYVTEGSFDAYSWQTVTRKAGFIAQIMRGRLDVREIEDIGDAALSFDEVKALATGDPRVLDKAKADADLTRLERLERAHHRNRDHLVRTARDADRKVTDLSGELAQTQAALGQDLLGAGGLVGRGRELVAAESCPGGRGELQPTLKTVPGVDGPVPAALALRDPGVKTSPAPSPTPSLAPAPAAPAHACRPSGPLWIRPASTPAWDLFLGPVQRRGPHPGDRGKGVRPAALCRSFRPSCTTIGETAAEYLNSRTTSDHRYNHGLVCRRN